MKQQQSIASLLIALALVVVFIGVVVEAKVTRDDTVVCHPDYPEICVGDVEAKQPEPTEVCPDLPNEDNCTVTTAGGWMWTMRFVTGLPAGSSFLELSQTARTAALTGLEVLVTLADDEITCTIAVGDDESFCDSCSVCTTTTTTTTTTTDTNATGFKFSADCTNVEAGRIVECEPVLPIFYPLNGTYTPDNVNGSSAALMLSAKLFPTIMLLAGGFATALFY
mmetsp:Transcript_25297/g.47993  ORF Transcript_25297/g.47993 Transcript_25297/m.47993 type:complete len:223 (-) Transcript_25297:55-723(-)